MSLASQLHDLRLSIEQFNVSAQISSEEEQRIAHAAAKLSLLLDGLNQSAQQQPANNGSTNNAAAEDEGETLLSIAQQYGIRVADLRKHNAHLKHYADRDPLPKNTPVKIKSSRKGLPIRFAPQQTFNNGNGGNNTPAQSQRGFNNSAAAAAGASPTSSRNGGGQQNNNNQNNSFAFDTIRSISKEHNVHIDALIRANKVLQKYDVDEALPQDLDIILPQDAAPAQRTFVLTFAGETLRVIADTVARCRLDDLMAVNPQLVGLSIDARLPEGTRIALPR